MLLSLAISTCMKFPPAFLDEIRARLPVSEVVGRRVKLRKQGREWAGLSPFNAEKTPSFFVNDQKGFFHDFSSGKHGDIFSFLIETEGLSFPDAVERLATMAGVPMPRQTGAEAEQEKSAPASSTCSRWPRALFEDNLQQSTGAKARGYLSDRGIGPAVQQRFSLGFSSPERFALRDALAGQGRRRRSDDRGRPARSRRGDRRALRPVSRPGDVPDPRPRRPGHRLRRPGDGPGRDGEISQFARDARFSTRARCSSTTIGRERPRMNAARSSSSKAISIRSR